jgi:hypothetical protein
MPTPSSPGVSGNEESRIERSVKKGKKMSRDEKVKGIYGVGLKKGKGKLTVHSEDLLNSDKL